MGSVIRSVCILVVSFTVSSAQLPPEIQVDKYLIHAEQLHTAKDYAAAFDVMQKIIALQKEHSLAVPDDFHFRYAQVALSADSMRIALESVTRYLSATGKEGQHYQEALKVMLKAEGNEVMSAEDFYNDVIKAEGTCNGLPEGSKCWLALSNHPQCYVWNDYLDEGETAIWQGKCSGHVPDGDGTLTWEYAVSFGNEKMGKGRVESKGHFRNGRKQGKWVKQRQIYDYNGRLYSDYLSEPNYVNGQLQGYHFFFNQASNYWRMSHFSDGEFIDEIGGVDGVSGGGLLREWSVKDKVLDNNGNGHLVFRAPDGSEWGGPYINWKRQGKWVQRNAISEKDYEEGEGSFVNGKAAGRWTWRISSGTATMEGSYVENKKHGTWTERNAGGDVISSGAYVDGTKHGKWTERNADGDVISSGAYVDGKKHGKWIDQINRSWDKWPGSDEKFDERFVGEGYYVEGEEHGQWVYRHPNGDILKFEYYDRQRYLPILWYDYDEEKCWRMTSKKRKKVNKKNCLE